MLISNQVWGDKIKYIEKYLYLSVRDLEVGKRLGDFLQLRFSRKISIFNFMSFSPSQFLLLKKFKHTEKLKRTFINTPVPTMQIQLLLKCFHIALFIFLNHLNINCRNHDTLHLNAVLGYSATKRYDFSHLRELIVIPYCHVAASPIQIFPNVVTSVLKSTSSQFSPIAFG